MRAEGGEAVIEPQQGDEEGSEQSLEELRAEHRRKHLPSESEQIKSIPHK